MFGYENTELPRAAGGGQHHPPGPQRGAGRRALQVGAADRAVGGDGDGRVQGRNPAGLVARPRQPLLHDHLDEGRHRVDPLDVGDDVGGVAEVRRIRGSLGSAAGVRDAFHPDREGVRRAGRGEPRGRGRRSRRA